MYNIKHKNKYVLTSVNIYCKRDVYENNYIQ